MGLDGPDHLGAHADVPGALTATPGPEPTLPARVVTAPGVLLKDWQEDTAVAFVTGSASTLLLTREAAVMLTQCAAPADTSSLAADAQTLEALLAAGLLRTAA